jgi:hypothetical protein
MTGRTIDELVRAASGRAPVVTEPRTKPDGYLGPAPRTLPSCLLPPGRFSRNRPYRFATCSSYFGSFELIGIGGAIGGSGKS